MGCRPTNNIKTAYRHLNTWKTVKVKTMEHWNSRTSFDNKQDWINNDLAAGVTTFNVTPFPAVMLMLLLLLLLLCAVFHAADLWFVCDWMISSHCHCHSYSVEMLLPPLLKILRIRPQLACCDAMLARVFATATCLSVRPSVWTSVTRQYCA